MITLKDWTEMRPVQKCLYTYATISNSNGNETWKWLKQQCYQKWHEMNKAWRKTSKKPILPQPYEDDRCYLQTILTWHQYTRCAVQRFIEVTKTLTPAKTLPVMDFGAGIGMSTIDLAAAGRNVIYCDASEILRNDAFRLFRTIENFPLVRFSGKPPPSNIVFSSEVFEHIPRFESITDFLDTYNCQFLYHRSSFGADSAGHYSSYFAGDELVPEKLASRRFRKWLESYGWERIWKHAYASDQLWRRKT